MYRVSFFPGKTSRVQTLLDMKLHFVRVSEQKLKQYLGYLDPYQEYVLDDFLKRGEPCKVRKINGEYLIQKDFSKNKLLSRKRRTNPKKNIDIENPIYLKLGEDMRKIKMPTQ